MEDKELIARVRHGDSRLFSVIVGRYSGEIFSRVLSLVKREDLAQEVTQQTFIRVYTRLDDWRGGNLHSWIITIAMHIALNALDAERRHRTEDLDERAAQKEDSYSDEHEELLRRMERAIAELQPNDQAIIRLHYDEGKKADDIAQELKMTKSNVLVRLHRIREQLKKKISYGNDK